MPPDRERKESLTGRIPFLTAADENCRVHITRKQICVTVHNPPKPGVL